MTADLEFDAYASWSTDEAFVSIPTHVLDDSQSAAGRSAASGGDDQAEFLGKRCAAIVAGASKEGYRGSSDALYRRIMLIASSTGRDGAQGAAEAGDRTSNGGIARFLRSVVPSRRAQYRRHRRSSRSSCCRQGTLNRSTGHSLRCCTSLTSLATTKID